jgi:hypothetical protein
VNQPNVSAIIMEAQQLLLCVQCLGNAVFMISPYEEISHTLRVPLWAMPTQQVRRMGQP